MKNERTFKSVNDVSRYVNVYHACYVGNGTCAPFNRDVLRGWLRELDLTDEQINTFCVYHDIPHVGEHEHDTVKPMNICELAHAVCKTCGTRVKWGLRVCDTCYANEHDTP